jgi:hypothetical protein
MVKPITGEFIEKSIHKSYTEVNILPVTNDLYWIGRSRHNEGEVTLILKLDTKSKTSLISGIIII